MTRRLLIAALATLALLAAAVDLAPRLFRAEDLATPAPDAPADATSDADQAWQAVRVLETSGAVERRVGDSWSALEPGMLLAPDDVIRTGNDGELVLDIGGTAQVAVDPSSQISVPALTRTASRVALEQGRVAARVPGGSGRTFGISLEGSDAVAETERGDFAVIAGADGEATVAATEGAVRVRSGQDSVTVQAGEQSQVRPGRPPGAPQAIPTSLFLKVERPRRVVRHKDVPMKGTTAPGAVITVNGVRVRVSEQGQFTTVVPLEEGRNRVVVRSRDVTGRREESEVEVTVDSKGPSVGGDVTWGP